MGKCYKIFDIIESVLLFSIYFQNTHTQYALEASINIMSKTQCPLSAEGNGWHFSTN